MSKKKKRKRRGPAPQAVHQPRRRRRALWILLAVGLVAGLAAVGTWRGRERITPVATSGGAAKLAVTPRRVNLGDMRLEQWARVSLDVTNVGTSPLRFEGPPWVEVVEGC